MNRKRVFRYGVVLFLLMTLFAGIGYTPSLTGTGTPVVQAKKKPAFNAKKALKKLKFSYQKTDKGILATVENNYVYKVDLTLTIEFKDPRATVMKTETIQNMAFPKGKKMVYFFRGPQSEDNSYIDYAGYTPTAVVNRSYRKDYTNKILITPTLEKGGTKVLAQNTAPVSLIAINVTFVFYNNQGTYMGAENTAINCTTAGTSQEFSINMAAYNEIPGRVEVYKNWAY